MMRLLALLLHPLVLALLILGLAANAARSATDGAAPPPPGRGFEIVIIEAPNCSYCAVFRRDVWPAYQASSKAAEVPMRFLDINDEAFDRLGLKGPVTIVPTAIILRANREVGRIAGTMGPQSFFQTVRSVIASAGD